MVYFLALCSALANALTSILQRIGVENAPADTTLRLSLLAHALKRGIWLLGFALMIVSFLMQAVALHLGNLSQVQPLLTMELIFLVVILATWFRFKVGTREWVSAVLAAAGLAGFLIFAQPTSGSRVPDGLDWIVVGGICGAVVLVAIALAMRGPRWWRAAMFGTSGAVTFAFTASLTKTVTNFVAADWVSMFWHWQTYGLAVCGVLAVFLTQNAYHAGPIAASQSTLVLVDPLASILIGIALFNDSLRTSGAWGPLEALSLLVMFVGAGSLATSPLISGVKGESDHRSELLSLRSRSARLAAEVGEPSQPLPPPLIQP
jgi:drug/metabolite transporter (DMT)-like permease